jgi:hypothetical protein
VLTDPLLAIYLLNLVLTLGMFAVLMFRAWLELKNYRLMWREMEWQQTYKSMSRILKAEKDLFSKVEGGDELYQLLLEVFKVNEKVA